MGGTWVRLGFVVLWGDTDQCSKLYQLHVIVTVVTAIVFGFFLCLFSFKTMVSWVGDAQNFILIYDFYIYICFCKNVEFLCA